MESRIKSKLKQLIKEERVIPVVGAGVSRAVAGLPNWNELLERGLTHAEDRGLGKDKVEIARIELNKNELLKVGETLRTVLGRNFKTFLKDQFDNPKIKDDSLLDSILNLDAPFILTTNYDNIFNQKAKLDHFTDVDWLEYEKALGHIRKKEKFVFHIHGHYENADSIILSTSDYDKQNKNDGYLHALKEIARDYHFLFIGCSQDGVLDEGFTLLFNFLGKWFPKSENEHFFLALSPDEGMSNILVEKANICALSYGTNYSDLPDFLHKITPNPEKRKQSIVALIKAQGVSLGVEDIDQNSKKLKEFKENIAEYNKDTADKRGVLGTLLSTIKKLSKDIDYESALGMWDHVHNIKEDNILIFIHIAVQSHNLLSLLPDDVLNDLKYSRTGIHRLYFDGYLTEFIREYEGGLVIYKGKYIDHVKDDKYFFENLHRIIRSLKALVNLTEDDVYHRFSEKFIRLNDLKEDGLILVTNKAIYFRSSNNLNDIYAKCEIKKISKFSLIKGAKGMTFTFIYDNALFGFSVSDPNDLFLLLPKSQNRRIVNYQIQGLGDDFLIKIFDEKNWSLYLNKTKLEEHYYPNGYKSNIISNDKEIYYVYVYTSSVIFTLDNLSSSNRVLVKVSSNIRENIFSLDVEQISNLLNEIDVDINPAFLKNRVCINLKDVKVTKLSGTPYLIIRVDLVNDQLLILFNVFKRNDTLAKYVKLKKQSICYDIVNGKDLLIGYLDTSDEESLRYLIAEYYPDFMQNTQSQLFFRDKLVSKVNTHDVFGFTQISANEFWLNIENVYLYSIDIATAQSQQIEIELVGDERIGTIIIPN